MLPDPIPTNQQRSAWRTSWQQGCKPSHLSFSAKSRRRFYLRPLALPASVHENCIDIRHKKRPNIHRLCKSTTRILLCSCRNSFEVPAAFIITSFSTSNVVSAEAVFRECAKDMRRDRAAYGDNARFGWRYISGELEWWAYQKGFEMLVSCSKQKAYAISQPKSIH